MKSKNLVLTILLLAAVFYFTFPGQNAYSYWIWTPKTGKWINPKYAPKDTPQEQYAVAMGRYNNKEYEQALRDFTNLVHYFPRSKEAAEGQFYVGVCYEKIGYYYQAFQSYQKTLDEYPYTGRFKEIIAREYRLGALFLGGAKVKYWKIALFPSYEKAVEIFKKVVDNDPYSKYAASAQYNLGEAYKKLNNYQDATLAFIKLINTYPDSNLVADAKFQVAYCSLKASSAPGYDEDTTNKAIKEFEDYLRTKPDSEFAKEAKEALTLLKDVKAKSAFDVAQFYEKQGQLAGAEVYYNEILDLYPESSWAPLALVRMRYIKQALGEEWQEPELPKTGATALSKKALEAKMATLKPQKANVISPVVEEPTLNKPEDQIFQPVQTGQKTEEQKLKEKQIVFRNPIILNQINCQNEPEIAKIWIWTDKTISFSHSYSEVPPRIYFQPIEDVVTNLNQMVQVTPGIVSSITIVKIEGQIPENLKDHYGVGNIMIETKIPVKYSVVPENGSIVITVEKKK